MTQNKVLEPTLLTIIFYGIGGSGNIPTCKLGRLPKVLSIKRVDTRLGTYH
jgi:hypothetical protein